MWANDLIQVADYKRCLISITHRTNFKLVMESVKLQKIGPQTTTPDIDRYRQYKSFSKGKSGNYGKSSKQVLACHHIILYETDMYEYTQHMVLKRYDRKKSNQKPHSKQLLNFLIYILFSFFFFCLKQKNPFVLYKLFSCV